MISVIFLSKSDYRKNITSQPHVQAERAVLFLAVVLTAYANKMLLCSHWLHQFVLKMYSQSSDKPRKSAVCAGLRGFISYSHSIVAGGLEVIS